MATSGMMVTMHKTGGIAKRLTPSSERAIADIMRSERGNEVILERAGGAFTFEVDVKAKELGEWEKPKRPARAGNQRMDVDRTEINNSYYDPLWDEEECDEIQCTPCESYFHRP